MEETVSTGTIYINQKIFLADEELDISFIRSSGPGGQNVNKVSTAVQLRFDIGNSSLSDEDKEKLLHYSDRRITKDGVIVIKALRFRTQEKNRKDAVERLVGLITAAVKPTVKRKPTRMSKAAKKRRLDEKKRRSGVKEMRKRVDSY